MFEREGAAPNYYCGVEKDCINNGVGVFISSSVNALNLISASC